MPCSPRYAATIGVAILVLTCYCPSFAAGQGEGAVAESPFAPAGSAAVKALTELNVGRPQELIVLFDSDLIEEEAAQRRRQGGLVFDDDNVLRFKAQRFRRLKEALAPGVGSGQTEIVRDYGHLPMTFARFRTRGALEELLRRPETVAVYENREMFPHLSYSLPFINQPPLAGAGITGSGLGVAVIDSGIDYTLPAFGSCSAPGVPNGCRVAASVDVTGDNLTLNQAADNHGTNVAGIAAGAAPGAQIVSINAFSGGASTVSWVLAGIDWAIENRSAYNISSLNMSLGDGGNYTSPCDRRGTNPFLVPLSNARAAGILPVASSGNAALTSGMASPACTPGVVSVGAVYDASWGGPYAWGGPPSVCSDSSASAPDMIPCFSNSASFLTMLAPGAFITAAGIQMAGTSQAAPHVAAAAALLRFAHPSDTLEQTVARMTATGTPVSDARNGVTTPRLNMLAALGAPANDNFADRIVLPEASGSRGGNNLNATKEPGEPAHAGGQGGRSVWWSWTPSESGRASIDGAGSGFSPLLGVYTGSSLESLEKVADGSGQGAAATFDVRKGTEYLIALDGAAGASGSLNLNWQFALQADLLVAMAPPISAQAGSEAAYTATVTNNGPSIAREVTLTSALPSGVQFVSASSGCSMAQGTITCALGDLESGAQGAVQVVVTPDGAGALEFAATVASSTVDPVSGNNAAIASCSVSAAPEAVPALSNFGIAAPHRIPEIAYLLPGRNGSSI